MFKHIKYQLFMSNMLIFSLMGGPWAVSAHADDCDFGPGVWYKNAVPCFIETITDTTRNALSSQQIYDVGQWFVKSTNRLGEFLRDLKGIGKNLEAESNPDNVHKSFEAFVEKWKKLPESFPHFDVLASEIKPIVDDIFIGLPEPDPVPANATSPTADTFAFYQTYERYNPWGLGSFFKIEPLPEEVLSTQFKSVEKAETDAGYRNVFIDESKTDIRRNDEDIFSEVIEEGRVKRRVDNTRVPTLLEEYREGLSQQEDTLGIFDNLKTLTENIDVNNVQRNDLYNKSDNCKTVSVYRRDQATHHQNCVK